MNSKQLNKGIQQYATIDKQSQKITNIKSIINHAQTTENYIGFLEQEIKELRQFIKELFKELKE